MTRTSYLLIRVGEDGNSTEDLYPSTDLRQCLAAYVHDRDGILCSTVLAQRNGYVDVVAKWERKTHL